MLPLLRLGKGEGTGRDGAVLAHLSAKIGSIDDNKIGGWYSYRASKAGLNQCKLSFKALRIPSMAMERELSVWFFLIEVYQNMSYLKLLFYKSSRRCENSVRGSS